MTQTTTQSLPTSFSVRADRGSAEPQRVGRWRLTELVAEGNITSIWRARAFDAPAGSPATYALKMLHPTMEDDPRAAEFLLREAVVGRSVSHPHVVPILAAKVSRAPRMVVMPWLEGCTLRESQAAERNFDVPEVLWIARQAAEGLGALHEAGWMHGDVKPGNLVLAPEGHVTLIDLGFARRNDESGSAVDRCVVGTCGYMAPELIVSAYGSDIRSDIYSLGVVLYELFAGRLPYEARDLAELASAHQETSPPELRKLAPHLPVEVAELVRQMIAKEPLRRPQSPAELVERLISLELATFTMRTVA